MENKEAVVRKIAKKIAKKYNVSPPVDLDKIIREKGIVCMSEAGLNFDGYSSLKSTNLKIVLGTNNYEQRKRFTIAHELGHIFISWHDDIYGCNTDNEYSMHNMLDIQEREANIFASELLMPEEWVKGIVNQYLCAGIGTIIKELCKRANTSVMACLYALQNAMGKGYIIMMYSDYYYPRYFVSDGTPMIGIQGGEYSQSFEWLSERKEYASIGTYNITLYKLPDDKADYCALRNGLNDIGEIVKYYSSNYKALVVWCGKLLTEIQDTYSAYLFIDGSCKVQYRNKKSNLSFYYPTKDEIFSSAVILNTEYLGISISSNVEMIFIKEPIYTYGERKKWNYEDSKSLLTDILNDNYDSKIIASKRCKINGIR